MNDEILAVLIDIRNLEQQRIQAERISNLSILDINDASFLLGYKISYMQKLVSNNYIPYYRSANGNKIFFKKNELEDWATTIGCATGSEVASKASEYIVKKSNVKN